MDPEMLCLHIDRQYDEIQLQHLGTARYLPPHGIVEKLPSISSKLFPYSCADI